MSCRLAILLLVAALGCTGCEATLGSGNDTQQDAAPADSVRVDVAQAPDAAPDARTCTGGNAAALAPDGSCLVHVTTAATYVNAKTGCAALGMGAHLAYLKNAALDTFAENFIGTVDTWIGGNDIVTEMSFVWEDGTPFSFTNWATNEPNNANNNFQEDCVIIAGARVDKKWDDRPCDATEVATSGSFAYLCQY